MEGILVIALLGSCTLSGAEGTRGPRAEPQPASRATSGPAHPPASPALDLLLSLLKDEDPGTRRVAALALGRLGEPEAMWSLVQTGANDPNRAVRFAAVEGLLRLGLEGDERRISEYRERFLGRSAPFDVDDVDLKDVIQFLRLFSDCSVSVDWRALQVAGIEQTAKVTIHRKDVTPGEALCSLFAALPKPAGFLIDTRLRITSREGAIRIFDERRRYRAWLAEKKAWGMQTEAGRRTLVKLQRDLEFLSFTTIDLKDVVRFFQEYADVPFRVDWQALGKAGIDRDTPVTMAIRMGTVERAMELVLREVSRAAPGADARLEWLIDGGTVWVSTREEIDKRVSRRPPEGK